MQLRLKGGKDLRLPPATRSFSSRPAPLSLPCSSGSTAVGGGGGGPQAAHQGRSCSSCTQQRAASSGVRCWRRPTPSKCPHPAPASLPQLPCILKRQKLFKDDFEKKKKSYTTEGLLWTKLGSKFEEIMHMAIAIFHQNAQEHVTALIVYNLRTSTSLAGHVTFLSVKYSKDFLPNEQNNSLQRLKIMEICPEYIIY